ncbi:MAG: energy-coupling factor transporter transmembrane protein EcfT [Anaerolineaceae bacterium]|nr:energy-coupling factor transporter transmembrane protein EcfT [Anaerolineaceae bacterium]
MLDMTYEPGDSFLHRLAPNIKFIGLIVCTIFVLISKNLACLIVSVVLITLLMFLSKLSVKTVFLPLKKFAFFLIMIFMMNALFSNDGNCIYSVWILCISKNGIINGFNIVLRTFTITVLSSIFIRTTTSIEIMKGLEKILKPLRVFKIPTRDLALIMSISLQFIPVFFNDITRIRNAQIARGSDFGRGSLIDRAKAVLPLVIPAFISAFRRADELSLAIEARGFTSDMENFENKGN